MFICFFWIFPPNHFVKYLLPLVEGERCSHTCGQIHMKSSAAPQPPFPFWSPLCPHLGPRAAGAPGAEQGTPCSAENWGALIRTSQTSAALLCQSGQSRYFLGDSMQIPGDGGGSRGEIDRGWGGRGDFPVTKIKCPCDEGKYSLPYRWHLCCLQGDGTHFNVSFYVLFKSFSFLYFHYQITCLFLRLASIIFNDFFYYFSPMYDFIDLFLISL